jgi:hypothetical protein
MKTNDRLLEKYYNGETSLEEEKLLKESYLTAGSPSAEKDLFGFYEAEGFVPADLEESVFKVITGKQEKAKARRMWVYSFTSAAASILIIMTVFLGIRNERIQKMENNFFVMEQALYQVSQSIQPAEEEEMLVLWVDENVEIIIN